MKGCDFEKPSFTVAVSNGRVLDQLKGPAPKKRPIGTATKIPKKYLCVGKRHDKRLTKCLCDRF